MRERREWRGEGGDGGQGEGKDREWVKGGKRYEDMKGKRRS